MKYCIHSERLTEGERRALERHGYQTVALPKSRRLSDAVCDHPDLSLLLLDGHGYTTEEHAAFIRAHVPTLPLTVVEDRRTSRYPEEAALCVLTVGRRAFYHAACTPDAVLCALKERGYDSYTVRQGYAACTVLALDADHAVTADAGMARAMVQAGIEVLTVADGGVLLPPYPYGFLGGATGVDGDTLYTVGDLSKHPCGAEISALVGRLGMRVVSLSDGPLRDCGRLLFFEDDL